MSDVQKRRPLVFVAVGVGNTLVDFTGYTLLTQTVFKGGSIALAGLVSGTIALVFAFLAHSFITWRGTNVSHQTVLKFIVFTGFGMWIIRPLLLALFIHLNGIYNFAYTVSDKLNLPFSRAFIYSTGAFGFMIVVVLVYNYVVYDRFVFNDQQADRTGPKNHSAS